MMLIAVSFGHDAKFYFTIITAITTALACTMIAIHAWHFLRYDELQGIRG